MKVKYKISGNYDGKRTIQKIFTKSDFQFVGLKHTVYNNEYYVGDKSKTH